MKTKRENDSMCHYNQGTSRPWDSANEPTSPGSPTDRTLFDPSRHHSEANTHGNAAETAETLCSGFLPPDEHTEHHRQQAVAVLRPYFAAIFEERVQS